MPHLFDLPPEIRVYIYKLVLMRDDEQPILVTRGFAHMKSEITFSLLRTSRAIFREAAPVFYGENAFRIDFTPINIVRRSNGVCITNPHYQVPLENFITCITAARVKLLSCVLFTYQGARPALMFVPTDPIFVDLQNPAILLSFELRLTTRKPFYTCRILQPSANDWDSKLAEKALCNFKKTLTDVFLHTWTPCLTPGNLEYVAQKFNNLACRFVTTRREMKAQVR